MGPRRGRQGPHRHHRLRPGRAGRFTAFDATVGEVESTKSVSEIYAPLAGKVLEVNPDLEASPELVNSDPYGAGWIAVVELADAAALDALMDAEAYRELTEG